MADLATKLSNIPPTLLRNFLLQEEEDTLFLNNLEEELAFASVTSISRRKLAKIADFFELKVSRYHFCLLYTSPSPRDLSTSRMPSSA